ncbi:Hypothetical predicted protein [Scomber scombrus]|uniref:Uncharacterized protein n=1 Tax=Scomber scombrus TaxID=13677 RepID=A0AAV1NUA0_SCOSC
MTADHLFFPRYIGKPMERSTVMRNLNKYRRSTETSPNLSTGCAIFFSSSPSNPPAESSSHQIEDLKAFGGSYGSLQKLPHDAWWRLMLRRFTPASTVCATPAPEPSVIREKHPH